LTQLVSQRDEWSKEDSHSFASVAREFGYFLHAHMEHERYELFEQAARTLSAPVKEQLCKDFEALDVQQARTAAGSRTALGVLLEKYQSQPAMLRPAS
jgi:hemerythrin-like domain-containing protein